MITNIKTAKSSPMYCPESGRRFVLCVQSNNNYWIVELNREGEIIDQLGAIEDLPSQFFRERVELEKGRLESNLSADREAQ